MTFTELQREVLQRTFVCGADNLTHEQRLLLAAELIADGKATNKTSNPALVDQRKSSCVLAAATLCVAEHGVGWCQEDLERFIEDTLSRLGFWVSVVLFFFGGVGFLWIVARIVLPILVDWLVEQEQLGVCGTYGGDAVLVGLANEAVQYLNQELGEINHE